MTYIVTQLSDYSRSKRILSKAERLLDGMVSRAAAEPDDKIKVKFVKNDKFCESHFNITKGSEECNISVNQLFPSGHYVKEDVCSQEFIVELTKVIAEADSLKSFSDSLTEFEAIDRLESEISEIMRGDEAKEQKYNRLVSDIIPLSDNEVTLRDTLEEQMVSYLKKLNEELGKSSSGGIQ